jgi:hypothetical protein
MSDEKKKDQQIGTDIGGNVDGSLSVAGGDIVTNIQQLDTSQSLVIISVVGIIAVVAVVALVVLTTSGKGNESQTASAPVMEEAALLSTTEPTPTSTSIPASPLPTMTEASGDSETSDEVTATATVTPSSIPTQAFTQTLYDDDFVGWISRQGAGISGSKGSLGGYLIEGAGLLWTSQSPTIIGSNFELSTVFEVNVCGSSQGFIGVLFSFDGSSRFIAAGVECGGEMVLLNQMTAVERTESAGTLDDSLSLGTHTLTVRVEDGTFTMDVDGRAGLSLVASNIQPGQVGLYVDGREGRVEVLYLGLAAVGPPS